MRVCSYIAERRTWDARWVHTSHRSQGTTVGWRWGDDDGVVGNNGRQAVRAYPDRRCGLTHMDTPRLRVGRWRCSGPYAQVCMVVPPLHEGVGVTEQCVEVVAKRIDQGVVVALHRHPVRGAVDSHAGPVVGDDLVGAHGRGGVGEAV